VRKFEIRMLSLFGYRPHLNRCGLCQRNWEELREVPAVFFSLERGTLICNRCSKQGERLIPFSLGTARLIDQAAQIDLSKLGRIKFTSQALAEGRELIPRFISYQLGKELKSLKALRETTSFNSKLQNLNVK
jgi:DNA repair protein RecO (recombination protein O)